MVYNILAIGDIHFGAMDPDVQFYNLFAFIEAIHTLKNQIDLIVINGDYFDYKLQLNSKSALRAIEWFNILYETALDAGVKKIRIIKGTEDHDHNQLDAFSSYVKEGGFLKIFNENTVEETLPGMKCIYCPDETIYEEEYMKRYLPNIMQNPDIGFFHGSFDSVLPDIALNIAEKNKTQNIIYYYSKWATWIKGPMISSHWHDPLEEDALIYIGSYDAWEFGHTGIKGFGLICYDTESNEYAYTKIANPYAIQYKTFSINTSFYHSHMEYSNLADTIDDFIKENPTAKIRIDIKVTDDREENHNYISALQQRFMNSSRRVKFNIVDTLKKKKKQEEKKQVDDLSTRYHYLYDNSLKLAEKLQKFLLDQHDITMDIADIQECIDNYITK